MIDTMNTGRLVRLITEAVDYPLARRVAAALYMDNVTEKQLQERYNEKPLRRIPDPMKIAIQNELHDLHSGFRKTNETLIRLAERL
jgi:hypothetical protein